MPQHLSPSRIFMETTGIVGLLELAWCPVPCVSQTEQNLGDLYQTALMKLNLFVHIKQNTPA